MATPTDSPFRIGDGSKPAALPQAWPPHRLQTPAQEDANGNEHSPTIAWPPAGGPDDATKPYKNTR